MNAKTLDDLLVYQKSIDACGAISALMETARVRRDCELCSQLGASSAAVSANIAEGFGQQSDRQFVRYLFIARGSCHEVRAHLAVARGRQYVDAEQLRDLCGKYEEIAKMLSGLIKYLRASDRKQRG